MDTKTADRVSAYQRARASMAFTCEDIRAIREGRLRITHRPFSSRFAPGGVWHHMLEDVHAVPPAYCSFGMPGDWVWVREAYALDDNRIVYAADLEPDQLGQYRLLPYMRMAKHQSRLQHQGGVDVVCHALDGEHGRQLCPHAPCAPDHSHAGVGVVVHVDCEFCQELDHALDGKSISGQPYLVIALVLHVFTKACSTL